jgi:ubiquinone/menaquinone biosynthesis C-methylase UbiE
LSDNSQLSDLRYPRQGAGTPEMSYVEWLDLHHRVKLTSRQWFVRQIPIRSGDLLLDAGAGPGLWTELFLNKLGSHGCAVSCDIDQTMLSEGRNRNIKAYTNGNAKFVQGDVRNLPFADGRFDIAFIGNTLDYSGDARGALSEMARTVRPGGIVGAKGFDGTAIALHPIDPVLINTVASGAYQSLTSSGRGGEFDNALGRRLPAIFKSVGLTNVDVKPYTVAIHGPTNREQKIYLSRNAQMYADMASDQIDPKTRKRWLDHFDPYSPDYILDSPDLCFKMIEILVYARVC